MKPKKQVQALGRDRRDKLCYFSFHDLTNHAEAAGLAFGLGVTDGAYDLLLNVANPMGDELMVERRTLALVDTLADVVRERGLQLDRRYRFEVRMPDRYETDRYELVALYTRVAYGTDWMLLDRAGPWEKV